MHTEHDYYGHPVEVSRVELRISDSIEWSPEMLALAKANQDRQVESLAKRMPHSYWHALAAKEGTT